MQLCVHADGFGRRDETNARPPAFVLVPAALAPRDMPAGFIGLVDDDPAAILDGFFCDGSSALHAHI